MQSHAHEEQEAMQNTGLLKVPRLNIGSRGRTLAALSALFLASEGCSKQNAQQNPAKDTDPATSVASGTTNELWSDPDEYYGNGTVDTIIGEDIQEQMNALQGTDQMKLHLIQKISAIGRILTNRKVISLAVSNANIGKELDGMAEELKGMGDAYRNGTFTADHLIKLETMHARIMEIQKMAD